jgi:putative colanic acid biosynthesis glycosyltransferase WcaI
MALPGGFSMPRILVLSSLFSPDGAATAGLLTDTMLSLKHKGYEITVLTTTPHHNVDRDALAKQPLRKLLKGMLFVSEIEGIKVYHVPVFPKGNRIYSRIVDFLIFHFLGTIYGLVASGKWDIIFSTTPPSTVGLNAWLLGTLKRKPYVYVIREIYPDVIADMGVLNNEIILNLLERVEKFVYGKSRAVVVISEYFKHSLLEKGVPKERLHFIPDFADIEFVHPMERKNKFSNDYKLDEKFVVLYAGNMGLTAGLETIPTAAKMLQGVEEIHFLIVGGGARYEWLKKEITEKKLSNITLLPYQPKSMVPLIYAASDLCLVPVKGETSKSTLPSKVYTVMAASRPVLASVHGNSELALIVNESQCGFVVKPDDAQALSEGIMHAYDNREDLGRIGRMGREYVERNYSLDSVAEKYDELLKGITMKP